MKQQFHIHNSHLEGIDQFVILDPNLRVLNQQRYIYSNPIIEQLPIKQPGIYTLTGGRQIGKTTLIKQWMLHLMKMGVKPHAIFFFTGEMIDNHHTMLKLLQNQLSQMPKDELTFLIFDEVSYIADWDKCIKFAADANILENTVVILSGSDTTMLQEARMRFPGRRGKATKKDFHIYSLSFADYLLLTKQVNNIAPFIAQLKTLDIQTLSLTLINHFEIDLDKLYQEFDTYLCHGGYLTAINDMATDGKINYSTLETYSDWIRGDVIKRDKQERYLKEIISAIVKRYNSQVTWPSLAADLSIDHPNTVADYCNLLEKMDALFIQQALLEDKLLGAPKKARKIIFTDPFIYHAMNIWISGINDEINQNNAYLQHILPTITDPIISSQLVEACVATHFRRHFPTYYIKSEGEVDIAYVHKNRFWPIEVKWTQQIRPKDLKQISKYKNGMIYAKTKNLGKVNDVALIPLVIALLVL